MTPLETFFDHSQENKSGLELKIKGHLKITPENSPNFSRLAFCVCWKDRERWVPERKETENKKAKIIKANGTHVETIGQVIDRTLVETL